MHFMFVQESAIHQALFWVAVSVLQLDEVSLYASGLALLEQNLHTLDYQGSFDNSVSLLPITRVFQILFLSFVFLLLWKRGKLQVNKISVIYNYSISVLVSGWLPGIVQVCMYVCDQSQGLDQNLHFRVFKTGHRST